MRSGEGCQQSTGGSLKPDTVNKDANWWIHPRAGGREKKNAEKVTFQMHEVRRAGRQSAKKEKKQKARNGPPPLGLQGPRKQERVRSNVCARKYVKSCSLNASDRREGQALVKLLLVTRMLA